MALEGKASGMFYRYPCYLGFLAWPRYSGKLLSFFFSTFKGKAPLPLSASARCLVLLWTGLPAF